MKISYNTLKKYIKNIKPVEEVAEDLIMHTAEVEEIIYSGENLKDVYIGEVKTCEKHPDSEKLNCTKVEVNGKIYPIVCGAKNVKAGIKVAVALVGAKLTPDFEIKKTKIRGETSEGMICSEDELGLIDERQEGIMVLKNDAPLGKSMRDYLSFDETILEIDNKAINHRPDLFSHIGIIREICAINNDKFEYSYENRDFSNLDDLKIKNNIPKIVNRYIGLKVNNVENIETPDYIKEVLKASECDSKGLLIDISNYSLYMYGQPTHIFDADKIDGNIIIRNAKNKEKFLALDDKEYELSENDIVITDENKILALGGIIGGKESSVTKNTKNIIIEGANFEQSTLRMTGKRLGIRTDSLNVFEKDLLPETAIYGVSLIVSELEKNIKNIDLIAYSDSYEVKQQQVTIDHDIDFTNKLIGKKYSKEETQNILKNLGIEINENKLIIPSWRKDLNYKADIAEEIARIDGYGNIENTIPEIQLGAIVQDNSYKARNIAKDFFTSKGFFDMYTYSFVNESIMQKMKSDTSLLIELKNSLSEEATHMKNSLIPNLMLSLEKNIKSRDNMKLFEIEKVFKKNNDNIDENYNLSAVITSDKKIVYYDIQNELINLFKTIGIDKYSFDTSENIPSFAHKGRTAKVIIRGQSIGYIGEISPKVAVNFEINSRIGFFEIDFDKLSQAAFSIVKAKQTTNYQTSNFDISFIMEQEVKGKDIKTSIEKTDINLIDKVELFDIYDDKEKLGGKKSLSFKVYISKMDSHINDEEKNKLINEIVKKVEKKGAKLR